MSTLAASQPPIACRFKELHTAAEALERLSHNQDALRAAGEELANGLVIEELALLGNVNSTLMTLDDNIDAVR